MQFKDSKKSKFVNHQNNNISSNNKHLEENYSINKLISKNKNTRIITDNNNNSNINRTKTHEAKKIVMKKVMTVKTEVDEEEKEFILEDKKEIENKIKQTPKKLDEPVLEIDVDVDEDENVDKSNINITKYTFISNDNCKNILFNSMNLRKIDVISPLKSSSNRGKGISRNSGLSGLNSSTGIIPFTHRAGNYFQMNK